MAIDEKELEILRKAAAKVVATDSRRSPWQEHFTRGLNVNQEDVLDTSVVAGFAGGWASSYNYGEGSQTDVPSSNSFASDSRIPTPIRKKVTKLGKPGVSDVDFVPYNWRTNRVGVRGPSLVGHPISYSVRGPTLKSPFTNWTWKVTFGGGPNGGDLLEMDVQADGTAATATSVNSAYSLGDFVMGDVDEPNGGVYLIIHLDGSQDGSVPAGRNGLTVLEGNIETATNEIFRISGLFLEGDITTNGAIELHPDKPLQRFYTGNTVNPSIAGITMFTPYIARMVAIPGSGAGVGREQTFVTITPEEAAGSDNYPPFGGGSNTWLSGGFEASGFSGSTFTYQGTLDLPIPRPLKQGRGTILRDPVGPTQISNRPGTWTLTNVENHAITDENKSVFIYDVEFEGVSASTIENVESALGWYFIDAADVAGEYRLNRVVEVNPETGFPFFGPGPIHIGASGSVKVFFTVHDRIDTIWLNTTFDIDNVEASRLRNIINPRDVKRTTKLVSETAPDFQLPAGATPALPDRAIFNTKSTDTGGAIPNSDDPGNLADLGFRVVIYPSKLQEISQVESELQVVPDFDRPLIGNDVIIDPSIAEDQYIEYDYASGTLYLSHAPSLTEVNDILPTGPTGSTVNNRRSEVVLFVACVPGSMEPSQRNGGMRVVCQNPNDTDLFSSQVISAIDTGNTVIDASAPFFSTNDEVVLSDSFLQTIPESGIFDVVESGIGTTSFGTWLYRSRREQDFGDVVTVLEGISSLEGAIQPVGASISVIFRRDAILTPNSDDNSFQIDDVRFDTTYGSSARASTLRFAGATCTQQTDGSVKVEFPGGAGTDLSVEDEGSEVESATSILNFTGQGVTAASVGGNQVNVTINGTVGIQEDTIPINPAAHFLNFEGAGVSVGVNGLGVDVIIPGGAAAGAWVLQDTQFVAAATASILTFSGLLSELDGIYCFMGRIISDGLNNLDFTIEPDSVSASQKTIVEGVNNTSVSLGQILTETSDLFLCFNTSGADGGPGNPAAIFFEYYIYPKLALHGGAAATAGVRITHGRVTMTIPLDAVADNPTFGFNLHGLWNDTTSTFTNIDIVGDFLQGTEVSLYKITV